MRVEKVEGAVERALVLGMLTDKPFLSRVDLKWRRPGLFRSRWANVVADWALDFLKRYDKAPEKEIEVIFRQWADTNKDKDTIALLEKFLGSLSEEWETRDSKYDTNYLIGLATKHFNEVLLERLSEEIRDKLTNGDHETALSLPGKHSPIDLSETASVDVLRDIEAMDACLAYEENSRLIEWPGDVGEFLAVQDAFDRGCLLGVMAPAKSGKSFILLDMAWRAMRARHKVACFQVGDMTQNQIMRRFMVRAARHPRLPCEYFYPRMISQQQEKDDAVIRIEGETRRCEEKLDIVKARQRCEEVLKWNLRSKETHLRLSCHPNGSITAAGIKDVLSSWDREGWTPDVVVIDYSDLLAPMNGKEDERASINNTWKTLRSISQERNCLLVTATQTKATSYGAKIISRSHFADDRRKLDHVTAMLGVVRPQGELRQQGALSLNWVALRDDECDEQKRCWTAGCLALANPIMRSLKPKYFGK